MKKESNFNEFINRFIAQIELREGTKISESGKLMLVQKWALKQDLLKKTVLKMEQQVFKTVSDLEKDSFDKIEFQIGISLSGEPIICTHLIRCKKTFLRKNKPPKLTIETKAFGSRSFF